MGSVFGLRSSSETPARWLYVVSTGLAEDRFQPLAPLSVGAYQNALRIVITADKKTKACEVSSLISRRILVQRSTSPLLQVHPRHELKTSHSCINRSDN